MEFVTHCKCRIAFVLVVGFSSGFASAQVPKTPSGHPRVEARYVTMRDGVRIAIAGADRDNFARYPATGEPTWTVERNRSNASKIVLPMNR